MHFFGLKGSVLPTEVVPAQQVVSAQQAVGLQTVSHQREAGSPHSSACLEGLSVRQVVPASQEVVPE